MIELSLRTDFGRLERSLQFAAKEHVQAAIATALTRLAVSARTEVVRQLPTIFDRPTRFTMSSVRYEMATVESRCARVFISEDANRGLSPRKYLGPQIIGGGRGMKGSERALQTMGRMAPGQWVMPSQQLELDQYGNVSGSLMTKILSRIGSLTESGYSGNASKKTKERQRKMRLSVKSSGTDYFVARSRQDERPFGIYQLVSRGHVRPVIIFANKAPHYQARFHFSKMVEEHVRQHWHDEMMKALLDRINSKR